MNTIRDTGVRAVGVNAVNQKLKNKKNKNKKNKQENHSAVVKSSVSIIVLDKKRSLNQEISCFFWIKLLEIYQQIILMFPFCILNYKRFTNKWKITSYQ